MIARRRLLATAAAVGFAGTARAADYPSGPISFLVPDSGGGSFDAYVRKFGELTPPFLPHHVDVEPVTVPGAGGQAAAFQLLHDAPDGQTIGMLNIPGLFTNRYNPKHAGIDISGLTWVANLGRESYGVAVSATSDIRNVAGLAALGAKRPVAFSSTGFGSTDYFATRVFASALGLNFKQVIGYTGSSPTMVAVARGDVDAVVHSLATLRAMQGSGLIRIVFAFQPDDAPPGLDNAHSVGKPELAEIYQWRPVAAPPDLPAPILATLSTALVAAAKTPAAAAWAQSAGTTLHPLGYQDVQTMIAAQKALVERWKYVLKSA
jgi:tripartite-type tricarboxylate transporter receptor subunit TctC